MNAKEGFLMFFIFRFLNLCAGLCVIFNKRHEFDIAGVDSFSAGSQFSLSTANDWLPLSIWDVVLKLARQGVHAISLLFSIKITQFFSKIFS